MTPDPSSSNQSDTDQSGLRTIDGFEYALGSALRPRDARRAILDDVLSVFDAAGVDGFVIKDPRATGSVVGVRIEQRGAALRALTKLSGPGLHLRERYDSRLEQPVGPLDADRLADVPSRCLEFEVARFWAVGEWLTYGIEYGCRIEFWAPDPESAELVGPPQRYPSTGSAAAEYLTPATIELEHVRRPSITLFDRTFLDEVTFPIDVVYTWVDGADPVWRERMLRARAEAGGEQFHPEAVGEHRYASRDELRYSLRSLAMYAPWVRNVYLVTDSQLPTWLSTAARDDHPNLSIVDHRDIFTNPSVLPVFNSNAIISQLHHIDGLAEHYLYLNDDMFFGRDARPSDFFFANGIAKVFPSDVARSFGTAHAGGAPHFNLSRNIRAALEQEFGRTISKAIWHTGYPQLRSANLEIEQRFRQLIDATAAQRFRHHDDIALDQFFHYYAQLTGRAVTAEIDYQYINLGEAAARVKLRRLLAARDLTVFCLNDAAVDGVEPVASSEVDGFLEAYFPVPSEWETGTPAQGGTA